MDKRLKLICTGLIALVLIALVFMLNRKSIDGIQIGVIEPMAHIAISDVTRGIQDGLNGYDSSKFVIKIKNANGDVSTIPQIIEQYKDFDVDIFVPIFTQTSQVTKKSVNQKPIVFVAVTDPVSAGLIQNLKSPEGNITGVSDLWPIETQFKLIQKILPDAKRVGILFDPNDIGSMATMPLIRKCAEEMGFQLVEKPIHSATEIAEALPWFKGKIDYLFTANDVTTTKSFAALVAYAIENKIPLFAGDYSSVQRGAIAAIGQNYYNVGLMAAKTIIAISNGNQVANIPVQYVDGENGDLYLNLAAAEKMGVKIPEDISLKAKVEHIYKTISEGDNQ